MPRKERSLAGVVRAAEEVLRNNRVDHVFVGAISVIVFGEPRTTRDVDVLARIPEPKAGLLARDFRRKGFFASEYDHDAAIRLVELYRRFDAHGHAVVDVSPDHVNVNLDDPVARRHRCQAYLGLADIYMRAKEPEAAARMQKVAGTVCRPEDPRG